MHAFEVLADGVRRRIVELLSLGEQPAGALTAIVREEFGISQPAVSQHLKVLRENGFATVRADGTRRIYRADTTGLDDAEGALERLRAPLVQRLDALHTEIVRGQRLAGIRRPTKGRLVNPLIEKRDDHYRLVFDEVYATDIDDLWDAVTSRERLARWMADVTGDLRLGGPWEVASDGETWCRGTVTACDAPRSFTTTWHATGEEQTELIVRLEPTAGGTRLVLEHTGIQSLFYGAGWETYLERLARTVADPGADLGGEDAWQARYAELQPAYQARFGAL